MKPRRSQRMSFWLGSLLLVAPMVDWCGEAAPAQLATAATPPDPVRAHYYDQLDRLMPGWTIINKDAQFVKWLEGGASQNSASREQQLKSTFDAVDARASARIFEQWLLEVDRPLPAMRREDLLWIGAVTFDEVCRGCHTLADATQRIGHYTVQKKREIVGRVSPSLASVVVGLFFEELPDAAHVFVSRANFEIAGLVTLLTDNAFGSREPEMPPGGIAAMSTVSRMAGLATRLDPGIAPLTIPKKPRVTDVAREWRSKQFGYAITVPPGWLQIPASEITKVKKRGSAQIQKLIWETAFQRDYSDSWFQRPYFIVQVTTPAATHLHGLPTVQQFRAVADVGNMREAVASQRIQDVIDAISDPADRATVQGVKDSLAVVQVQSDVPNREYWFSTEGRVGGDVVKMFSLAKFLQNGFLIQISGYADVATAPELLPQFHSVGHSVTATTTSPSHE